jgi:hypothetical protein
VGLLSAWIRLCVWYCVCYFHNNSMHVILENNRERDWDWLCCYFYMTTLLFSAAWTWTQLGEQILPCLMLSGRRDLLREGKQKEAGVSQRQRILALVTVTAFAALYQQGSPEVLFWAVNFLTMAFVGSALSGIHP